MFEITLLYLDFFQHIPFLRNHLANIDKILEDWKQYKLSVPTYGAILLSEDLKHVLLVQSFWSKCSWGFPKGKVNENEDPMHCATREVYEETGFDITKLIVPTEYIELIVNFQFTRLYIVRNVPLDTHFQPKTRCEIKCCDWFLLEHLPSSKHDELPKIKLGMNSNSFFMVLPFIKRLKKWINDITNKTISNSLSTRNLNISNFNYDKSTYFSSNNNTPSSNSRRQRHKSMGDIIEQNPTQSTNSGNNKIGQPGTSSSSVNYKDKKHSRGTLNPTSNNFASVKSAFTSTSTPIQQHGNPMLSKSQITSNNKQQQRSGNTVNNPKRKLFHDQAVEVLQRHNGLVMHTEAKQNARKVEFLSKIVGFQIDKTAKAMAWDNFTFDKDLIAKAIEA